MSLSRERLSKLETLESRQLLTAAVSNTDVLASFAGKNGLASITAYLKANPKSPLANYVDLKHSKSLFAGKTASLVQVRLAKGVTAASTVKLLKKVTGANWASPNYVYAGQPGDGTPNDYLATDQLAALKNIQLSQAWDVTTGSGDLLVAVVDDGYDFANEDLQGVTWNNADEIAGNGIDDDRNGYIDDTRGYDFASGDNDASPAVDTVYNYTETHGTLVASIIGATMNNGVGISGVAAGVKIMPVRFRGFDATITSAGIAQSIAYAADNGAKIINLSYSWDPWMNDPAFYAAVDKAYDAGVLWINSSGNAGVANPPRTAVDKILFVNNVDNDDVKFVESNYGDLTDLSSPGTEIWGAAAGGGYYPVTGTSFATAVSSGIAALIWSKHPTWTRDQVAAQLLGSADDIDAKNPAYAAQLGTGRVNAYQAVATTIAAPKVRGLDGIASGTSLTAAPTSLTLRTFSVLDAATVNANSFELRGAGADGKFDTADDKLVPLSLANSYAIGTNKIGLNISQSLSADAYRFTAKTTIADPFGQKLSAPYTSTFYVGLTAPAAPTAVKAVAAAATLPSQVTVTWTDNATNEAGFVVERSLTSTFAAIDATFTVAANVKALADTTVTGGKTYYYRVRAYNGLAGSANAASASVAVPVPQVKPAAPTNLTAVQPGVLTTEVKLTWADNSNNESGFVLQRSTSSTFASINRTVKLGANVTTYTDTAAAQGTQYYYRVAALNSYGTSAYATVAFKTGTLLKPSGPTSLTATSAATGQATLKWADNSNNETSFVIEASLTSGFSSLLTRTATVAANSTGGTLTGLWSGWTYYFRVRAYNAAGYSAYSGVVAIRVK